MAQLLAALVSDNNDFRHQLVRLLRSSPTAVSVIDDRSHRGPTAPDVVVVDVRHDSASSMAAIERIRSTTPGAAIFAVANEAEPNLILEAMRAGANEFFTWPLADDPLHEAIQRTAARREAVQGAKPSATALLFFGAKGGAGTTTIAVNCAVELARLSKQPTVIIDLKQSLGEIALFLGVRPRFTILDAIDNLHRLDREFLRELVTKHKSGLDILAGSEQFDRPAAEDGASIEELFRLLAQHYTYVVVDAGSQITSCTVAGFYASDTMYLVANPDVASVRNAQRLLDRARQLGVSGERVRLLLNRAAEPFPIPAKQIVAAVGHPIHHTFSSDYKIVSSAINAGVPIALSGDSTIAVEFDHFTRGILQPVEARQPAATRSLPGLSRIASFW